MKRHEFLEILQRNDLAMGRKEEGVGGDWIEPYLLKEAEQDRNALILLCTDLGRRNKQLLEKLNEASS